MKVITPPVQEVISISDVAEHLRLGPPPYPDETLLITYISAARGYCEQYLCRAIGEQVIEDTFRSFDKIVLRPPVANIEYIKYLHGGVFNLLQPQSYVLSDDHDKTRVMPAYGQQWPYHDATDNAVVVRYSTGYTASNIPSEIKVAMLLIIGDMYKNREASLDKQSYVNIALDALLSPYRLEIGL